MCPQQFKEIFRGIEPSFKPTCTVKFPATSCVACICAQLISLKYKEHGFWLVFNVNLASISTKNGWHFRKYVNVLMFYTSFIITPWPDVEKKAVSTWPYSAALIYLFSFTSAYPDIILLRSHVSGRELLLSVPVSAVWRVRESNMKMSSSCPSIVHEWITHIIGIMTRLFRFHWK